MARLTILIIGCFLTYNVFSQSLGGSAYTAFGIGDLQLQGFGAFSSMGKVGIGARSPWYANTINPAGINAFQAGTKSFDFGAYSGFLNQATNNSKETKGDGGLSHFNLLLKPNKKFGISLGMRQVSNVAYNLSRENVSTPDLGLINVNYGGDGGLSQFDLGVGFEVIDNLNFGIRGSLMFGNIEKTESVFTNSEIRSFNILNREGYAKFLFDIGLQYDFKLKDSELTIGAVWNPGFEAFSRSAQVISNALGDTLTNFLDSDLTIPQKIGFGASWLKSNLMVNIDVSTELWDLYNANSDLDNFENVLRLGIGAEYVIDPSSHKYEEQIRWRVGFRGNNYYQSINGTNFGETALSLGMGLPAFRGASLINLGYEFHSRGTRNNELILETGHVFSVGLTFRELWFTKTKYD